MERKHDPADIRYGRIAELYDAVDYVSEPSCFSKSRKQLLAKVQHACTGVETDPTF